MKSILFVVTLLIGASCSNFDIVSSSVCTDFSKGFCTKWEQNGTVQQQLGSCFPSDTRVISRGGPIEMGKLKKGDQILGLVNGQESYVKVTSWLHKDQIAQTQYLQLNTQSGWLQVSAKHNMATMGRDFRFAEQTDSLYPAGKVSSVMKIRRVGKYAPKTTSNNFFVLLEQNKTNAKALAHCFAHIRNPEKYEFAFGIIQSVWDLFSNQDEQEIHPSFKWMQQTFTVLQE